jgi:hypothetical protein
MIDAVPNEDVGKQVIAFANLIYNVFLVWYRICPLCTFFFFENPISLVIRVLANTDYTA